MKFASKLLLSCVSLHHICSSGNTLKQPLLQFLTCSLTFNCWYSGCLVACKLLLGLLVYFCLCLFDNILFWTTKENVNKIELTQDTRDFNINVLFTFLDLHSFPSKSTWEYSDHGLEHILTPVSLLVEN